MTPSRAHPLCLKSARRAYWTQGQAITAPPTPRSYERPPINAAAQRERVDKELWDFFRRTRPTETQLENRAKALKQIDFLVTRYASNQGLIVPDKQITVAQYGSTLIGVDQQNSEVDFIILDPKRPEGYKPGIHYEKVPNALYNVVAFAESFTRVKDVQPISTARVPLVRGVIFDNEAPELRVKFNVCVNARTRLYSSRLLAAYVALDPRVAPLIVLVKEWAHRSRLAGSRLPNGDRRKGVLAPMLRPFSSYSISLLVVAYLQHLRLLPNLQEPFVTAQPESRGGRGRNAASAAEGEEEPTSPYRANSLPDDGSTPQVYWSVDVSHPTERRMPSDVRFLDPRSDAVQQWMAARDARLARKGAKQLTLNDLLQGFFKFFAEEFDDARWAISVRDGGIVSRLRQPGYRPPERFFNELVRDLRTRRPPPPHLQTEQAPQLREGDSLEADKQIARELALLLAAPTDVHPWQKLPLVIVDPILRVQNLAQTVSELDLKQFVGECKRAMNVLGLGLGLKDLLLHADPVKQRLPAELIPQKAEEYARGRRSPQARKRLQQQAGI